MAPTPTSASSAPQDKATAPATSPDDEYSGFCVDDYDPRRSQFVIAASREEIAREDIRILKKQATCLQSAVQNRKGRIQKRIKDHYEQFARQSLERSEHLARRHGFGESAEPAESSVPALFRSTKSAPIMVFDTLDEMEGLQMGQRATNRSQVGPKSRVSLTSEKTPGQYFEDESSASKCEGENRPPRIPRPGAAKAAAGNDDTQVVHRSPQQRKTVGFGQVSRIAEGHAAAPTLRICAQVISLDSPCDDCQGNGDEDEEDDLHDGSPDAIARTISKSELPRRFARCRSDDILESSEDQGEDVGEANEANASDRGETPAAGASVASVAAGAGEVPASSCSTALTAASQACSSRSPAATATPKRTATTSSSLLLAPPTPTASASRVVSIMTKSSSMSSFGRTEEETDDEGDGNRSPTQRSRGPRGRKRSSACCESELLNGRRAMTYADTEVGTPCNCRRGLSGTSHGIEDRSPATRLLSPTCLTPKSCFMEEYDAKTDTEKASCGPFQQPTKMQTGAHRFLSDESVIVAEDRKHSVQEPDPEYSDGDSTTPPGRSKGSKMGMVDLDRTSAEPCPESHSGDEGECSFMKVVLMPPIEKSVQDAPTDEDTLQKQQQQQQLLLAATAGLLESAGDAQEQDNEEAMARFARSRSAAGGDSMLNFTKARVLSCSDTSEESYDQRDGSLGKESTDMGSVCVSALTSETSDAPSSNLKTGTTRFEVFSSPHTTTTFGASLEALQEVTDQDAGTPLTSSSNACPQDADSLTFQMSKSQASMDGFLGQECAACEVAAFEQRDPTCEAAAKEPVTLTKAFDINGEPKSCAAKAEAIAPAVEAANELFEEAESVEVTTTPPAEPETAASLTANVETEEAQESSCSATVAAASAPEIEAEVGQVEGSAGAEASEDVNLLFGDANEVPTIVPVWLSEIPEDPEISEVSRPGSFRTLEIVEVSASATASVLAGISEVPDSSRGDPAAVAAAVAAAAAAAAPAEDIVSEEHVTVDLREAPEEVQHQQHQQSEEQLVVEEAHKVVSPAIEAETARVVEEGVSGSSARADSLSPVVRNSEPSLKHCEEDLQQAAFSGIGKSTTPTPEVAPAEVAASPSASSTAPRTRPLPPKLELPVPCRRGRRILPDSATEEVGLVRTTPPANIERRISFKDMPQSSQENQSDAHSFSGSSQTSPAKRSRGHCRGPSLQQHWNSEDPSLPNTPVSAPRGPLELAGACPSASGADALAAPPSPAPILPARDFLHQPQLVVEELMVCDDAVRETEGRNCVRPSSPASLRTENDAAVGPASTDVPLLPHEMSRRLGEESSSYSGCSFNRLFAPLSVPLNPAREESDQAGDSGWSSFRSCFLACWQPSSHTSAFDHSPIAEPGANQD